MTDKQKFNRYCMESWYRTQLSILEDIVFNYETGIDDYDETMIVFERNINFVLLKNTDGYLPDDLYLEYLDEVKSCSEYIHQLKKIRDKRNPNE